MAKLEKGPANYATEIAESLPEDQWKNAIRKTPASMQATVRLHLVREYKERRQLRPYHRGR